MTSRMQLDFFNKRGSSTFLTVPNSLDNYFRSSRIRFTSPKQIYLTLQPKNCNIENENLQCLLSKKVRGVKLSSCSEKTMKSSIVFQSRANGNRFKLSLEEVFQCYINYLGKNLHKALMNDKLSQNVIKPFLRIYSTFINSIHKLSESGKERQKDLFLYFEGILTKSADQKIFEPSYQERLQKYYTQTREFINPKVLDLADEMFTKIELEKASEKKDTMARPKVRPRGKVQQFSKKQTQKTIKPQKNNLKMSQKSTKTIGGNVRFQDSLSDDSAESDQNDLCYELALLINDTDRILKPNDDDKFLFLHD